MKSTTTGPTDEPQLTFWGAAASVGGSMHLLEAANRKILLDCGLHQGKREEARERNSHFPFHPEQLDAVIVSHAHIDHCGNLPTLTRRGYTGPIYCTPPTRDLLRVMLRDSAKIQEEDAAHINIARNYAEPWVQPLYTHNDVHRVFDQLVMVPFEKDVEIGRSVKFHFVEAGHILGSAAVHVAVQALDRPRTLTFTGDLGRRGSPILKPAHPIPPADVLVCESTYGNRIHEPMEETVRKLYDVVKATVARRGKVLIPAFALGRTQLIIHLLQKGLREGAFPKVPIYVDSPLAADIADVYRSHPNSLSAEVAQAVEEGHGILGGDGVKYVREFEESMVLVTKPGPAIIIASAGMCDAGRIVAHLKQNIDDPRCTVALVSYQAHGTTGRRLLENKPTIRFQGRDWNKWIDVVHLNGFSGHADRDDFLAYLSPLVGKVGKMRLIHGEHEQADAMAETLRAAGFADVRVPEAGESVIIG
ncbi:MAG: MBL fold metallo-hydrolase [Planctomycetia bacterium]|nr:MBL fold metallo-hydrolase [Planctomycetia bacterium]